MEARPACRNSRKDYIKISAQTFIYVFLGLALSLPMEVFAQAELKSSFDDVEIEKWDFGVVTDRSGSTGDWKLHPVVVIPNLPGIQYAWRLKTKKDHPLFVKEEFTLPDPPSTWRIKQGESTSELLKGGQQCLIESFQTPDEGWIGHSWTASAGDPEGKYEIKVWLNGKFAHHFSFNVGEPVNLDKEEN